eukprot:GILK01003492.1.p1 GENE.GILK01003492.1~~GILK01003492.1.p1  ORF type:complete len:926 (-),score=199.09 GILK01003492.1:120-2897(-)
MSAAVMGIGLSRWLRPKIHMGPHHRLSAIFANSCSSRPGSLNHRLTNLRAFSSKEEDGEKKEESDGESEKDKIDIESADVEVTRKNTSLIGGKQIPMMSHVSVLPLTRRPLFPGLNHPLSIRDEKIFSALRDMKAHGTNHVGFFLMKNEPKNDSIEEPAETTGALLTRPDIVSINSIDEVHQVGSYSQVMLMTEYGSGGQVLVYPSRRIRIADILASPSENTPFFTAKIEQLIEEPVDVNDKEIKAYSMEIVSTIKEILRYNPLFRDQLQLFLAGLSMDDPYRLADFGAALTSSHRDSLQEVLEAMPITERLSRTLLLLKKELEQSKIQQEIKAQVEEKVASEQRKYFLQQQLNLIRKELGQVKDGKEDVIQKFKEEMEKKVIPEEVAKVIEEEMSRFKTLDQQSSEYNVTRNYLSWLTSLPWGVYSPESYDITQAEQVLNQEHYGLEDIKERILEFIAVGKMKGTTQGKILCFVGPPGVGKTSIGRSIAKALNREFFRFSVGGLSDVAEIKGHRRTYVGAMPGKVVQALKQLGTSNPVILIDEVDKMGRDHRGDPASALLELLDPAQNATFRDHYLDVATDMSKVLFICTANLEDTIPGPLLDRMEIVRLSGYVMEEKVHIMRNYLEPQAKKETGLDNVPVKITDDAVQKLIGGWSREAGVRSLQKFVEKLYRKVALKVVKDGINEADIGAEDLVKYIGHPVFLPHRLYAQTPVGVVMGLAWNQMGGAMLYFEALRLPDGKPVESTKDVDNKEKVETGQGSFHITGQLGEVMKESAKIAYTYAQSFLFATDPTNDALRSGRIHMHVPHGATPKDGPSAGVTMCTALLSLALNRPARKDLAMTGEITLTGKVLRIGGVKEKLIAAHREGARVIVFPAGNKTDYEDLPDFLKKDIEVHFVEEYPQLFPIAFPAISDSSAADMAAGK